MSTVAPDEHTQSDAEGHDGHDDHGHHDHPDYLAHHFDTSQQQFDAGKLGIWLFLAQEVLFFSGLFVFYVYIKTLKPGAFEYAHSFLEVKYGLINTFVLITSSLTMAWGVRCAQLNQKNGLKICLALTLLGAFGFLGVKAVEYTNKWSHGLYWGSHYTHHLGGAHGDDHAATDETGGDAVAATAEGESKGESHDDGDHAGDEHKHEGETAVAEAESGNAVHAEEHHADGGHDDHAGPFKPPIEDPVYAARLDELAKLHDSPTEAGLYFTVYYCMTGLHAIHVVAGIVVILWIFFRALREDFHSDYFGPVDYVGLYWHLVDLVWIFLFPMLYLVR